MIEGSIPKTRPAKHSIHHLSVQVVIYTLSATEGFIRTKTGQDRIRSPAFVLILNHVAWWSEKLEQVIEIWTTDWTSISLSCLSSYLYTCGTVQPNGLPILPAFANPNFAPCVSRMASPRYISQYWIAHFFGFHSVDVHLCQGSGWTRRSESFLYTK